MKCNICQAENYHEDFCDRKYAERTVMGEYFKIKCIAERYPNTPLADTWLEIKSINHPIISWSKIDSFAKELSQVINKYKL